MTPSMLMHEWDNPGLYKSKSFAEVQLMCKNPAMMMNECSNVYVTKFQYKVVMIVPCIYLEPFNINLTRWQCIIMCITT